jgi:aryl-alcohol dehydrogenase-like predicted oxidoreductase
VIIGPRTLDQLDELMDGASLVVDDAILDRIDENRFARHEPVRG